jgi:hypothetical protein
MTKRKLIRRACLLAVVFLAALAFAQQEPSLGELVRQQKGPEKKAKRVVTNDEIPERPSPPEPAPAAPGATGSAAEKAKEDAPATAAKPAAQAKDAESEALAGRIEDLKASEDAEKRIIRKLERSIAEAESEFRKQLYAESLQSAKQQLDKYMKERSELENKLAAKSKPAAAK